MTKTQGQSSITISKLAFLDEMLPEPMLINVADWDEDAPRYEIENTATLLELIKKLAAKVLTEEELVNILGNQSKFGSRTTYTPNSKEMTH